MKLCDAFGLPLVSLCDTPGFMVGPEAEKTATARHVSRMFVTGANLSVPMVMIILRKAYGLGAQAMAGGSLKAPVATVTDPRRRPRRTARRTPDSARYMVNWWHVRARRGKAGDRAGRCDQ
jgi:acetyl-CoA carboxylase carboxyltransferase component